jgi:hypothetical protein
MRREPLRVEFEKGEGRRYRSLLSRADGVQVSFDGGAYNKVGGRPGELPHDLAHLIVEDELGLSRGVWGVLAAGGLFRHATVVAGRQPPHAAKRGQAVVDAAGDELMGAEILTRAVCDGCAGVLPLDPAAVERAVGERWWTDTVTRAALDRSRERLRAAATAWAGLRPGEALVEAWKIG